MCDCEDRPCCGCGNYFDTQREPNADWVSDTPDWVWSSDDE